MLDLPRQPGTYVLFVRLDNPCAISVGRRGTAALEPGLYAYTGSALGPGGLAARIDRHLRRNKRPHWHIDGLTTAAPVTALWWQEGPHRLECQWAAALGAGPGTVVPVPRFGASDCRCPAHLFRVAPSALPHLWDVVGRPAWLDLLYT